MTRRAIRASSHSAPIPLANSRKPLQEDQQSSHDNAESASSHIGSGRSQKSKKKGARGKTRNLSFVTQVVNEKHRLKFNDYGQPYGDHCGKFNNYLSQCVQQHVSLGYLYWEKVPKEPKDRILLQLLEKFDFEVTHLVKERLFQKFCKKYNDFKYNMKKKHYRVHDTTEERMNDVSEGVSTKDWETFVAHCDKPDVQKEADQNNRSQLVLTRHTGSKSSAQIIAEEVEKDPEHRNPTQFQLFQRTYTDAANIACDVVKDIIEKCQQLAFEPEAASMDEDEIFHKIIGPERHGRVRCYGLGPTPSSVFGKTHGRIELVTKLSESQKQNELLRSQMEELRKSMEQNKREQEELIKDNDARLERVEVQNQRLETVVLNIMRQLGQEPSNPM